ncbi:MFS family permease [Allocatelliglobosispora scoriae]|uniref:MFS family permease n=1 Tax=Allocatelliglobosispora scoriae TaxID=643052 RepID=A0A841BXC8_9ACTN|nr:MFS transporter [Allocatelliglobosispora scoriae]MBB5872814.1 MFS family permease [Allocatelliglobosispora scoriae]
MSVLPLPPALRRGRIATCLLFACVGMVVGTWSARIPAIKRDLGLSDGQLSIALLGFAAGAIIGMQLVGHLVERFGAAGVMVPAAVAEGLALITPGVAPNLVLLTGSLLLLGTVHGTLNIAMNTNAVEIERAAVRPMLSSFHAVYSVGGFLGAGIGGAFAYLSRTPTQTFAAVAVLVVALAVWARRWAYAAPHVPESHVDTTPAGRIGGVALLGALAFCCLVGEGAAADWSTVYLRDSLGSSPGFAAMAYAAFAISMMLGRLVGDGLTARFGPVTLVRGCAALAAAGLGIALLIGEPVAGIIGFACLGAGLSCIAPQVFSAAGNRDPARASRVLARVVSIGWVGFVAGPIMIGALAEVTSLPVALAIPVLLAVFIAATATALRPARPA